MCKRAAQAEPEERASTKAKLEPESASDAASELNAKSLTAWLEGWMKAHVASSLPDEFNMSALLEEIHETVGHLMDDNFEGFVEDLKSDHNVRMPDSSELQDKLFNAQVDYLHCAAMTKFLGDQFRVNFRNKKRFSEFEERIEESGMMDQLQFDVLYDFAMYIANRGGAGSDESDDEEPVEEDDDDEDDEDDEDEDEDDSNESSEGSGGAGGSGSESESESESESGED